MVTVNGVPWVQDAASAANAVRIYGAHAGNGGSGQTATSGAGGTWKWGGQTYNDQASAQAAYDRDNASTISGLGKNSNVGGIVYSGGGGGGGGGGAATPPPNRFEAGLANSDKRLRDLLDNPDSIQQSAAYKFRVGQGQEALQRSMGAKGMLNSGNRLMDLTKFGQDMGSQEYDAQFGRLSDLYKTDSNSYIGQGSVSNQTQDIANRFQLGTDANQINRDKINTDVSLSLSKPQGRSGTSGISNPWALPGYNGYNY
jgi:hypothetical protein